MSTSDEAKTIGVMEVVVAAMAALPGFLGGRSPTGIRVEEVVPPPFSGGDWKVTLSHLEPGVEAPDHPVFKALGSLRAPPAPERVLRVIEVDAETGVAKAMKIREPR